MALLPPDREGQVLCRSSLAEHIWKLAETDKERFKEAVREYMSQLLPNHTLVRADFKHRIIWSRRNDGA
jgi:hypothetical protein